MQHLLLIGPPGCGKSLLARGLRTPRMLSVFSGDASRIHRLAQMALATDENREEIPPFRAPHHTVSLLGLQGKLVNGYYPQPGEFSLAHGGVLFMDEVSEFRPDALRALVDVLKRKSVTLSTTKGSVTLPAEFRLIAAMGATPCGYAEGSEKCRCSASAIARHKLVIDALRPFCRIVDEPETKRMLADVGVTT